MRSGPTAAPAVTDAQRAVALRPSRYCPTDRMAGFAKRQFGGRPSATATVQAICDYVFEHITYDAAATGPGLDATETLMVGRGVCRDFAHLVATLCRANDVPARIAAVYAPGLSPMDFHAVVETAIDGGWWCWDATRLAPRQTLVTASPPAGTRRTSPSRRPCPARSSCPMWRSVRSRPAICRTTTTSSWSLSPDLSGFSDRPVTLAALQVG